MAKTAPGNPGAEVVTTRERAFLLSDSANMSPECAQNAIPSTPSVPSWPERDAAGRFVPGNLAAVKHALSAAKLPPEFEHLEAEVDAFVAGCLTDEGDEQDVSTRRRSLLNYRARVHRRIVQLDAAIEVRGLVDRKGKLRAGWLQRLEGLVNVAKGLDAMLGLERRQKRVPSLQEVMSE
jgi:hypothetical protein